MFREKKMDYLKIATYVVVFFIGFFSCMLMSLGEIERPLGFDFYSESEAPGNWIDDSQIKIYDNLVVIEVEDASLSRYAATGSMKPSLDFYSNGIRIVPDSEEQINVGDIVTFEENNQLIVHRVIEKGEDEQGTYFITRGDNNNVTDGKIRFKDIRYVTIALIY